MTSHTYRPDPAGATYYPMDGARQCDPLEPEDVIAALDAWAGRGDIVSNAPPVSPPFEPNTVYDSGAEHWSEWLEWGGIEYPRCPLPGSVPVRWRDADSLCLTKRADYWDWDRRCGTFRYLADNPAGWLPRGDWIPPAELWDEGCPVRCEWTRVPPAQLKPGGVIDPGTRKIVGDGWAENGVTHIRLVPRERKAELPEGWSIKDGSLKTPNDLHCFALYELEHYGPAAIRQAVEAWLREMGDE